LLLEVEVDRGSNSWFGHENHVSWLPVGLMQT
jgi:hypothetical protein